MTQAPARYALCMEFADGTVDEPYHHMTRKADAIRAARRAVKGTICPDLVRIWVDDTRTGVGMAFVRKGAVA